MAEATIKFKAQAEDETGFILELDEEKNAGQSSFQPGDNCFIRLFPSGLNPTLRTNIGTAKIDGTNIPLEIEEYLVFARSDRESFRYPCSEILELEWIGRDCGQIKFSEEEVFLSEKKSGVLKIRYRTFFDRISFSSQTEGKVLLEANKDTKYGYIVLDYVLQKKTVYLTVKDACSRSVIPGAQVFVDGQFVGISGPDGRICLGELYTGKHTLKIVKSGYQPTDEDNIANDEFIVSNDK